MAEKIAEPPLNEAGRSRIDNFVDSSFAFAVTLLVISTGEPPADLAGLKAALWRVPGFAMGFALLAMFLWSHRAYSRVRPEGAVPLLVSFALVFLTLIYVYPLRLLSDMVMSPADFSGATGVDQKRDLYLIYGAGFTALSALFLFAYAHARGAAIRAGDDVRRRYAADGALVWVVLTLVGLASVALAATLPLQRSPWMLALPGAAYALIPVGIALIAPIQWVFAKRPKRR